MYTIARLYVCKLWQRRAQVDPLSYRFTSPEEILYSVYTISVYLSRYNSCHVRDNLYRSLRYKFMKVKLT